MLKRLTFMVLLFYTLSNLGICITPKSTEIQDIVIGRNLVVDDSYNFFSDTSRYQIAKYNSNGQELFKIGQRGEGPGDIKRLGWFAINPKDSLLYVTELANGNKRISVFSPLNGKFVRLWPCKLQWEKWDAISQIQFDNQGNIYLQTEKSDWRPLKNFTIGTVERVIIKFDIQGNKIKEMYRLKSEFMAQLAGKGNITIPYSNYLTWGISGDRLFVREHYGQHIKILSLEGNLLEKISLPFPKKKITTEDIDDWQKRVSGNPSIKQGIQEGWFDLKFWRKNLPFPKFKWVSGGLLFFGPNGEIYSQKATGYGNKKKNIWAMISPSLNKIIVHSFPGRHKLRYLKNNYFYFTTKNEEGETILRILEKDKVLNP